MTPEIGHDNASLPFTGCQCQQRIPNGSVGSKTVDENQHVFGIARLLDPEPAGGMCTIHLKTPESLTADS